MSKTTIGWTSTVGLDGTWHPGYSFNPWQGCQRVSPGCVNCYAEKMTERFAGATKEVPWGPLVPRRMQSDSYWQQPLAWNRRAQKLGVSLKVFCASMADVFESHQNFDHNEDLMHARVRLWRLIEQTPHLNWLLLTKRPENIQRMLPLHWWDGEGPERQSQFPPNVWLGTSVENQTYAQERIPWLLKIPAPVHFLSCEPLLGSLDLMKWLRWCPSCGYPRQDSYALGCGYCEQCPEVRGISWVITGGESGRNARPLNLDWVRDIREQCLQTDIPHYFKQVGGRTHSAGGRILDGCTWDEFPVIECYQREEVLLHE